MLDLVRALEEREEQLARLSRQLVDVQRTAEAVGSGAAEASDVLARLPSARAGSDGELETARTACSDRRAELEQAKAADDGDDAARRRVVEAEWTLRRAADHLEQVEGARE